MMARLFLAVFLVLAAGPAAALEIAGVEVAESVTQSDGTVLRLNGAGVRSKFVFKVYLAMLYLERTSSDAETVLADQGGKQMIMHFLYSEVGRDDLVEAWNDGFSGNGTDAQLEQLKARIDAFNAMFDTVKEGDRIVLDYVPEAGTTVTVAGQEKGTIPGKDFNDLLLSIWLGAEPVGERLRDGLLGK